MVGKVKIFQDEDSFISQTVESINASAEDAITNSEVFNIGLCGGRSPVGVYRRISEENLPNDKWRIFFSDERCVPPDDENSNFRLISETLLRPSGVNEERVFRIRGELGPERGAHEYDRVLKNETPRGPHLLLLGLGVDGHVASLFPGGEGVYEKDRFACGVTDAPIAPRVSITGGYIERALRVILLVKGEEKRVAFERFISGREEPLELPSSILLGHPGLEVIAFF